MERGLRAKTGVIDDACNMTKEEISEVLQKLKYSMDKAVKIANKNTIRNEKGYVIIPKDDEWRNEDSYDEIMDK